MLVWALSLVACLVLSLRGYGSFQLGVYNDDARYIVLARSLAEGERYELISSPPGAAASAYPFGFPLAILPLVLLFPGRPELASTVSLAATLLNGALLFWFWRSFSRTTSYWLAVAVVALYLLSPAVVGHTRMVMSEPAFLTWCLLSILLAQSISPRPGLRWVLLMSMALILTVYTRSIGIVLLPAILAYWALSRRKQVWKHTLALILCSIGLLLAIVAATPLEAHNLLPFRYTGKFLESLEPGRRSVEAPLPERLVASSKEYVQEHLRLTILPVGSRSGLLAQRSELDFVYGLVGVILAATILIGYIAFLRREGASVVGLFVPLYLAAIALWMVRLPRFLYPVLPFLLLWLLIGVNRLTSFATRFGAGRRLATATRAEVPVLVAVLLVLVCIWKSSIVADSRLHTGDLARRTEWIRDNAEPTAILMTEYPEIDFLYGGRQVVPYVDASSPAELRSVLDEYRVAYITVAPTLQWETEYQPSLSPAALRLTRLLDELVADGSLRDLHSSSEGLIRVFKSEREPLRPSHPR